MSSRPDEVVPLPDASGAGGVTRGSTPTWAAYTAAQRWLFMSVLFLVAATSAMDRSIVAILLEPIKAEFATTDWMIGALAGAPFGICFALSSIPLGRMADRWGRKQVLFWSCFAWSIMTLLCGLAPTLLMLFIARLGVGLGEGGAHPPIHALIASYFPPHRHGIAFAILGASGSVGTAIASILGGWAAQQYGWRTGFLAMAALSLPVVFLVLAVLRDPPRQAVVADHAATNLRLELAILWRKRSFVLILFGLLFYALVPFGVTNFAPTYMTRVLGLDLTHAGSLFGLAISVGTIAGSLSGGAILDRLRRRDDRWLVWLPAAMLVAGCLCGIVTFLIASVTMFTILLSLTVGLLCAALPALYASVQHVCGGSRRALATSIEAAVFYALGMSLAPILTGALSDLFAPAFGIESLRYAIIVTCVTALPGAIGLLLAGGQLRTDAED